MPNVTPTTNIVSFVRTTSAQYKALAEKDAYAIYFLTDTHDIHVGENCYTDGHVKVVTNVPDFDTSVEDVYYIVSTSDSTDVYVKGETAMTKLSDAPSAAKVTQMIKDALADYAGAFVDVSAAKSEDNKNTVLTFTTKDGGTKEVTVADIFLTSASYDGATHILSIVVGDSKTPVEIDLSDLVGASLSDVKVDSEEVFTVELGAGATLGGFKTGDEISKDMSVETIFKKLLMKQVPPAYTKPSVAIANNSGTAAGSYEIGTTMSTKLKSTFTQNDAGALTTIQFKKNGTNIGDGQTSSPATYTEDSFNLSAVTTYTAVASYDEGAIKKDNLGQDYPEGHIAAGSITTSNYTFTPYRQGYFAGSSTDASIEINSALIRGLSSKKNGAYAKGDFTFTVPVGAMKVLIACPATNTGVIKILNTSALNADVTSTFTKSTVTVEGANGHEAINYNVWIYIPAVAYGQEAILKVTLG